MFSVSPLLLCSSSFSQVSFSLSAKPAMSHNRVSQISIYACCVSAFLCTFCPFFGANDPHILNPQKLCFVSQMMCLFVCVGQAPQNPSSMYFIVPRVHHRKTTQLFLVHVRALKAQKTNDPHIDHYHIVTQGHCCSSSSSRRTPPHVTAAAAC